MRELIPFLQHLKVRSQLLQTRANFSQTSKCPPQRGKQQGCKSLSRPLRLAHESVTREVLSVVPDGPPIQFQYDGAQRVANVWGPNEFKPADGAAITLSAIITALKPQPAVGFGYSTG